MDWRSRKKVKEKGWETINIRENIQSGGQEQEKKKRKSKEKVKWVKTEQVKGVSNEQAEMTEVRGDMKTALAEKKDYYEKKRAEKQLREKP